MRVALFLSVVLALTRFSLFAQSGNYYLSHYSPSQENIDHFSFDIAQDSKGLLYFANKAGVLQFDGRNWVMVSTPGPIYTLVAKNTELFVGGLSGFGKLITTDEGLVYESLSGNHPNAVNIFSSLAIQDRIYFLSHEDLFEVNAASGLVEKVIHASEELGAFQGIAEIQDAVYVSTDADELLTLDDDKLIRSQISPSAGEIIFSDVATDKKQTLIGTSTDRVFLFGDNSLKEIAIKDKEYIESNVLVSGAWLSESLIALGTLRGGVIFIDPRSGETKEIINYYTGLPDNEVYAMLADEKDGVWVAHDYGFTRIAPFLPFRAFNHYPGMEGNLMCAYSMEGNIYVGTTLGLFKLVKDEVYEEEVYFITRKPKATAVASKQLQDDEEELETSAKARRGLFGRGRKKDKKKKETDTQISTSVPASKSTQVQMPLREKRTRKVLKSLQYRYKKVEGITGKVTNLIEVEDALYAAGLDGVFRIDDLKATAITNEPVRSVFLSPSLNQLLISTYNEEIKSFTRTTTGWAQTHLLDTLQEYISYMFEDKLQNLWLCGRASTLKVEMIDGQVTNIDRIPYLKPSIDETVGLAVGTDVYVVNAGEFQRYDVVNSKFVEYDSLPGTRKYFASAGSFWFHDGHRWRTIDQRLSQSMQLEWLSLFSDIRYLTPADDASNLWVISASNELYRFAPDPSDAYKDYPLFLREIRGPQSRFVQVKGFQVEEEDALTFEFIQPEYVGVQALEYRYLVAGLEDVWSKWEPTNNVIRFPYLPSGEYEIRIQSKNLFGKVNELERIYFRVLPPYWRRPWFYALEVSFFSMLVLLTMRLSVSNSRYQPISRVLSLLTVIMFIQLVQTSFYSLISIESSPVIEFLLQVLIALLVLPLEMKIRNFMQKASEGKYELTKIIVGKKEPMSEVPEE